MPLSKQLPGIKLLRKIRYRKGFGVHSPFVYNLITKVIEEKTSYYAFEEIENFRKNLLTGNDEISFITAKETQSANYGAFLFRMVNFFKCRNVIQIGSTTGVMGLYLAMASRTETDCWLLEERRDLSQSVREFALAHNLSKLHYIEGDYLVNLKILHSTLPEADLMYINQLPASMKTEELMHWCMPFMQKKSILILNGIVKNKAMRNFWQSLKDHPQSRVTMDLYALGIVFFEDKLPKRQYKTYFNDGKKQNLHTHGRRRLHFIGRRKKSSQNQRAH
jgi:predicted O-methyltransferase YrrM